MRVTVRFRTPKLVCMRSVVGVGVLDRSVAVTFPGQGLVQGSIGHAKNLAARRIRGRARPYGVVARVG